MRNIKLTGAVNFEAVVVSWMKENSLDEIVFIASNSKMSSLFFCYPFTYFIQY